MASAADQSDGHLLERGSETFVQFPCSRCVKENKTSEAVKFCEDCFDYLCVTCLYTHNSWVAMRSHSMLTMDVIQGKSEKPSTFVRRMCKLHGNSVLEMFCTDHDVIMCSECCQSADHSSCSLVYLPKVSHRTKQSEEFKVINRRTRICKADCERVERDRRKDLTRVKGQNQTAKKELMDLNTDILNSLRKSVESVSEKIDERTTFYIEIIDKDLHKLQIMKSKLVNHEQLLKPEHDNDMQLFLQIHDTKSLISKCDSAFSKIEQNIGKETLVVCFQPSLKAFFEQDECIGTIIDERHPLYTDGDTYRSIFRGFCQLKDGRILATDSQNDKVKFLDSQNDHSAIDFICTLPSPWDACQVEDDSIAVTCGTKIQFINVENKTNLKSVCIKETCRGITYCNGQLYVCCGGVGMGEGPSCIKVLDKAGKQIHELNDTKFIGRPMSVAKSEDEQTIYVADNFKGVVSLDKEGRLIDISTHTELERPTGLTVGKDGKVYIIGYPSENIFEFNPKIKVLTKTEIKVNLGIAVFFDRTLSRLLLLESCRDKIRYDPI